MNAKQYVTGMIDALQEKDYEKFFELQSEFEDDIDNVSDEEWDKLNRCVNSCSTAFLISPQSNESEIITALRWLLE